MRRLFNRRNLVVRTSPRVAVQGAGLGADAGDGWCVGAAVCGDGTKATVGGEAGLDSDMPAWIRSGHVKAVALAFFYPASKQAITSTLACALE